MAREELSIHVNAKDDASKVLDQVGKKVDKLEGEDAEIKVDGRHRRRRTRHPGLLAEGRQARRRPRPPTCC